MLTVSSSRQLLIVDRNVSIDDRPMTNSASMNTTSKWALTRKIERQLIGMAMAIIAYLLEKAVLRSIKRSGKKSAVNNSAS